MKCIINETRSPQNLQHSFRNIRSPRLVASYFICWNQSYHAGAIDWISSKQFFITRNRSGNAGNNARSLLTQNTSWINAEKALFELYSQNLIDINALLNIPTENLAILIKSSGYYNQKAIKIRALVQYLSEHPISTLLTRSIEDLRPEIRGVKGCGNETCDSILLYALKKPIFVVDSYTKRSTYTVRSNPRILFV